MVCFSVGNLSKGVAMRIERKIYSAGQAAKILGVKRATIISWIRRGLIRGGRTPTGNHVIPKDELEHLIALMSGERNLEMNPKLSRRNSRNVNK